MKNITIKFFLTVFIITWLLWLPSVLKAVGIDVPDILLIISMMASFTPSIVGIIFLRKAYKGDEFKAFIKKRFSLRFSFKWWLMIPAIFLIASYITLRLTMLVDPKLTYAYDNNLLVLPLVFLQMVVIGGALGEEIGWRGFAYTKMRETMTSFSATLTLGLAWSLWHLPLFFMAGTVQSNIPLVQFMMQNTLIAFFYTWVYEQTDGNLLLMIYLHAIANTSAWLFPYWQSDTGRLIGFGILLVSYSLVKNIKIEPNYER